MLLLNDGGSSKIVPGLPYFLAEPARGVLGLAALPLTAPLLTRSPRGDGHSVRVLPGLGGDDLSTGPLRHYLRLLGYDVRGWGLGRNLGPSKSVVEGMPQMLEDAAADGKVTLIGWSLGGIFARELARRQPEAVRQVIALGSPYAMKEGDRSRADAFFRSQAHRHVVEAKDRLRMREPLDVPTTSVYSRSDGIVDWRACREPSGQRRESVEVRASHLGLGHSVAVMWLVADRLAQAEDQWEPFRPPARFRAAYPSRR